MMMKGITSLALAGALSIAALCQVLAGPVPTNSTALKAAALNNAIADVRWGGGWGWRRGGGWRRYYAYPYGGPYWGGGYVGYGYRPYYRRCVTHEGYGRFNPCDH